VAAQVCQDKGWTSGVLSGEVTRLAFKLLGLSGKRAKHWLTIPTRSRSGKKCATG
jgi:hypothetical protein